MVLLEYAEPVTRLFDHYAVAEPVWEEVEPARDKKEETTQQVAHLWAAAAAAAAESPKPDTAGGVASPLLPQPEGAGHRSGVFDLPLKLGDFRGLVLRAPLELEGRFRRREMASLRRVFARLDPTCSGSLDKVRGREFGREGAGACNKSFRS